MFSLARLRALALLALLPSFVASREEAIFASSVTYCNPPETLLIQRFDIAFFPRNQSVSFNISAASVEENVNVTANLFLNVYGMNPVNVTLDLCNVLDGALCPLPTYNFTGADSISLPPSLGINDMIPGIAFKIPDLEGFAQLTLTEIGTGDIKACVQATLSNGWSTHQSAVEWVTVAFALAALISALLHSFLPMSLTPFRFLDMFYLYQAIATSAFLDLNYPTLYRAFTLNFAWAVGLVSSSSSSSLQRSIDQMRHRTGGRLPDSTSGSAVGFVNRRLSPYNVQNTNLAFSSPPILRRTANYIGDVITSLTNFTSNRNDGASTTTSRIRTNLVVGTPAVQGQVQTVTADSSNVLEAGIPIYANSLHIGTGNAFMTAFISMLIVVAVAMAVLAIGYGLLFIYRRRRSRRNGKLQLDYCAFIASWSIILGLIFLLPLLIFTFYQWTLRDSWVPILLSVFTFLGLLVLLIYPSYTIFTFVRRAKGPFELYSTSEPTLLYSLGPLYAQYRDIRYYFFLTLLIAPFFKAIFIAFGHTNGLAQIILLLITELALFGLQVALKPHRTRGGDILGTYISVTRLVATGLQIAFLEQVAVQPIPRTVIGAVIAVIWAVAVVIVILNLIIFHMIMPIWNFVRWRRFGDGINSRSSTNASDGSMLEKGNSNLSNDNTKNLRVVPVDNDTHNDNEGVSPAISWDRITASRRPLNPTPDHNVPLDPEVLRAYPVSPTETVTTSSGSSDLPSSVYASSSKSGTITVGSLLPRRWSFGSGLGMGGGGLDSNMNSPVGTPVTASASHSQKSHSFYSSYSHSQPSSYPPSPAPSVGTPSPSTSIPITHSEESRLQAIQELPSQSSLEVEDIPGPGPRVSAE